jgi:hypothetical protein
MKSAFRIALPPNVKVDEEKLTNVLEAIINGEMQVWGCGKDEELFSVLATAIAVDQFSGERNLLIYIMYGYKLMTQDLWQDGLATLRDFAKAKGCTYIIGYTCVPRILEVVKELGGDTSNVLVRLEV